MISQNVNKMYDLGIRKKSNEAVHKFDMLGKQIPCEYLIFLNILSIYRPLLERV